MLKNLQTVAFS